MDGAEEGYMGDHGIDGSIPPPPVPDHPSLPTPPMPMCGPFSRDLGVPCDLAAGDVVVVDSTRLDGAEVGYMGDHGIDGSIPTPLPDHPSLPTPPMPMCGPFSRDQGVPCDLAAGDVVVVDSSVGGSTGGGGVQREILSTDGYRKLANKVFALAAAGTPPDDLFGDLTHLVKDERLLTDSDLFELAAAVGLLALMPGRSPEIEECAQALLECARKAKLPPSELLVLASLPDEVMVNRLACALHVCKEEHGYLLTCARDLHCARKRDFLGAAEIYSGMLEDEDDWTFPAPFDEAHALCFIPIDPEPMDDDELEEAIKMVTPDPKTVTPPPTV